MPTGKLEQRREIQRKDAGVRQQFPLVLNAEVERLVRKDLIAPSPYPRRRHKVIATLRRATTTSAAATTITTTFATTTTAVPEIVPKKTAKQRLDIK